LNYSVCIPAVFNGIASCDALCHVAAAGFKRYEFWSWWDQDIDAYMKAQKENGLEIAAICTFFISLTDPACREAYKDGLKKTIEVCKKLGCKTIISQVGQELKNVPRALQHASIVDGLKECAAMLEENDITLVFEPLNTKIDHPGYYLWSSAEAFEIEEEIGSSHVKVLFDLYHQYIMDDLFVDEIVKNMDKIAHFHVAGYPGRHEPLIDSEIDYKTILKAIEDRGYQGSIGLEYFPVYDAAEGLKILQKELHAF
jgi:hydroxypyruvate isomerase